jgi:hypothetical protein
MVEKQKDIPPPAEYNVLDTPWYRDGCSWAIIIVGLGVGTIVLGLFWKFFQWAFLH